VLSPGEQAADRRRQKELQRLVKSRRRDEELRQAAVQQRTFATVRSRRKRSCGLWTQHQLFLVLVRVAAVAIMVVFFFL
jgi:hypothetical protein